MGTSVRQYFTQIFKYFDSQTVFFLLTIFNYILPNFEYTYMNL